MLPNYHNLHTPADVPDHVVEQVAHMVMRRKLYVKIAKGNVSPVAIISPSGAFAISPVRYPGNDPSRTFYYTGQALAEMGTKLVSAAVWGVVLTVPVRLSVISDSDEAARFEQHWDTITAEDLANRATTPAVIVSVVCVQSQKYNERLCTIDKHEHDENQLTYTMVSIQHSLTSTLFLAGLNGKPFPAEFDEG